MLLSRRSVSDNSCIFARYIRTLFTDLRFVQVSRETVNVSVNFVTIICKVY